MDKRCFLVCGPESAGNRLLTAILVRAGCVGDAGQFQCFDPQLPGQASPAVVLRSMPHGGEWPDIKAIAVTLQRRGYRVRVLIPVRDPHALARSQLLRGHASSYGQALERIRRAYQLAIHAADAAGADWRLVPYEALTQGYHGVLHVLGLPAGKGPLVIDGAETPIRDGNAKHYAR